MEVCLEIEQIKSAFEIVKIFSLFPKKQNEFIEHPEFEKMQSVPMFHSSSFEDEEYDSYEKDDDENRDDDDDWDDDDD